MKRKSKNLLIAFLSILAIAGVGTTTAAILTNGFHRSDINDIINANKKDYVQIDLSNKYKDSHEVTSEELVNVLNYNTKEDVVSEASATSTLTQNKGYLISSAGNLTIKFKDGKKYDRIRVNAKAYYEEKYLEDGKTLDSYEVDNVSIAINDGDVTKLEANTDKKKAPLITAITYDAKYKQESFTIKVTDGRLIIQSIELWNSKDAKDEASDVDSPSQNTNGNSLEADYNENGIFLKVTPLRASASENGYGQLKVNYTSTPSFNTDTILYKTSYKDGSAVDAEVLTINQDTINNQLIITCNKVFTKQIILTLFAESNSSVKADVTIDFKERINPISTLVAKENETLTLSTELNSTGGSISIDKEIKNAQFTLNSDYVTKAEKYLKEDLYSVTNYGALDANTLAQRASKYSGDAGKYTFMMEVNFTKSETSYPIIGQTFTFEKFLTSTTYNFVIPYINKNGRAGLVKDVNQDYKLTRTLSKLSSAHLKELFNGVNPVFDYTYTINGVSYKESFPLTYDGVNASNISVDNSALIF